MQKAEPVETAGGDSARDSARDSASDSAPDSGDTAASGDTAETGDTGSGEGLDDLPDLLGDLDTTSCENAPGYQELAGATSYFVGGFSRDGDIWTGTETWLLFATSEWVAEGGADCQVVWDISGSTAAPDACAGCAFAVSFSASLDASLTDCSADLYAGDETYSASYDVLVNGSIATVYFSSTGDELGVGYANGGAFSYLTAPQCRWF